MPSGIKVSFQYFEFFAVITCVNFCQVSQSLKAAYAKKLQSSCQLMWKV